MIVLGIDPGLSGGIALVAGEGDCLPRLLLAADVPTVGDKAKRRVHVVHAMRLIRRHPPDFAVIERAQAMPDQGSSSGFIYGRAVGALEACIEGLLIPHQVIEATAWKKFHGLVKTDKENSRQRALKIFPDAVGLERKMDHNRAEAALMAVYGLKIAPRANA